MNTIVQLPTSLGSFLLLVLHTLSPCGQEPPPPPRLAKLFVIGRSDTSAADELREEACAADLGCLGPVDIHSASVDAADYREQRMALRFSKGCRLPLLILFVPDPAGGYRRHDLAGWHDAHQIAAFAHRAVSNPAAK